MLSVVANNFAPEPFTVVIVIVGKSVKPINFQTSREANRRGRGVTKRL